MKIIVWIKNKLHIHYFNKPIVSEYVSFHTRNIIFECRCGKCELRKEHKAFGDAFSIETTHFITHKEMNEILNKNLVVSN